VDAVFEGGELIDPYRAAGMKPSRCNADLRAESEFATIGELGRRIMQDNGGIHFAQELFCCGLVISHDCVGVM
jgi:hypothetical protein